jgi:hypothetical protein
MTFRLALIIGAFLMSLNSTAQTRPLQPDAEKADIELAAFHAGTLKDAETIDELSRNLHLLKRWDDSIFVRLEALKDNRLPKTANNLYLLTMTYHFARRFEDSEIAARKAIALGSTDAHQLLLMALYEQMRQIDMPDCHELSAVVSNLPADRVANTSIENSMIALCHQRRARTILGPYCDKPKSTPKDIRTLFETEIMTGISALERSGSDSEAHAPTQFIENLKRNIKPRKFCKNVVPILRQHD